MRNMLFIFFGLIVFTNASLLNINQDLSTWIKYKIQHNRVYNETEEILRHTHFSNNLKWINEHNNLGKFSFTVGLNKFADLSFDEFISQRTGLVRDDYPNSSYQWNSTVYPFMGAHERRTRRSTNEGDALPSSFSWVDQGGVNPVKDQGHCNACWAYTTIAILETICYKKTEVLHTFSEQMMLDCAHDESRGECGGGAFKKPLTLAQERGVMKEADYPFIGKDTGCHLDDSKIVFKLGGFSVTPNGVKLNEKKALSYLVGVGPIAVGFYAGQYFQHYTSGIIDYDDCNGTINHAVVIVGYGSENGKDYWLMRNSYGADWGLGGYFKVVRGKNMCGMCEYAAVTLNNSILSKEQM